MKKAQSLVEYTLILVLISLIAITTLNFLGRQISTNNNETEIDTKQNVTETMIQYCKLKGLIYNEKKRNMRSPYSKHWLKKLILIKCP